MRCPRGYMVEYYYSIIEYAVMNEKFQKERPGWHFVRVELHGPWAGPTEEYHLWLPPTIDLRDLEDFLNERNAEYDSSYEA